jgi:hypothetical protein
MTSPGEVQCVQFGVGREITMGVVNYARHVAVRRSTAISKEGGLGSAILIVHPFVLSLSKDS